ncbi:MAG: hypothetical protein ACE15D_17945 [Candidatus Eisenbacteria bacterium]
MFAFLAFLLLDAILTLPFVFHGPGDGETLRYVLSLHAWRNGLQPFHASFNAELSAAYYALARGLAAVTGTDLAGLPRLLNLLSWAAGALASGCLFLWWRKWFGAAVAARLTALLIAMPAFWSLHLYGNPNIVGLAAGAAALAIFPASGSPRSAPRLVVSSLLILAAFVLRADMLLLAPAVLLSAFRGRERPALVPLLLMGIVGFVAAIAVRSFFAAPTGAAGTFGRHLSSRLDLGSLGWPRTHLLEIATGSPPLVFLASLAAFVLARRPGSGELRLTTVLWFLPGTVFLFFAHLHVVRILIPLLPALLLPLAFWAAGDRPGRGRRDLALAGLIVASHLVMFAVPEALDRLHLREKEPRRASHWLFLGNVVDDHLFLARQARDQLEDARALARHATTPDRGTPPALVLCSERNFYAYAFQLEHPRARFTTIARGHECSVLEASDEAGSVLGYIFDGGPTPTPERRLEALGFALPAQILRAADARLPAGDRLPNPLGR